MKSATSRKAIAARLTRTVDTCIDTWLTDNRLAWADVYTSGSVLSERTARRIRKAEGYNDLLEWVNDVNKIYKRLHALAVEHGKPAPTPWPRFFGPLLPLPSAQHEPTLYNDAEMQGDDLKAASGPFVMWLLKEASVAKDQNNVWKASRLLNQACYVLELIGDWERAGLHLAELARLNSHTGDFHFTADAHLRRGQAQLHAGCTRDAMVSFESGLKVIEAERGRTPPHRVRLRLISYRAIAALDLNGPELARQILLEEALPLARSECSPPAIASVHNRLAIVALRLRDPCAAMEHVLAALECRLERNMRSEVARSLVTVARVHAIRDETEQSVFVWELSLALQQALNDYETLPQTYYLLASAYCELHNKWGGRGQSAVEVSVNAEWFQDLAERALLERVARQSSLKCLELRRGGLQSRATVYFRCCAHLERNSESRKYPDAAERAEQLVHAHPDAGQ